MLIAFKLWRLPDSNRPPSDCEPDALPDELNPQMRLQKYNKNAYQGMLQGN